MIIIINPQRVETTLVNLSMNDQLPLENFCQHNINDSIKPKLEPILCPYYYNHMYKNSNHAYFCPRLNNPNISIHQLTAYESTKIYWQKKMHQLKKHLGNQTVYFLGDSINGLIITQMRCLQDFAQYEIMNNIETSGQVGYPTQLGSMIYNFSRYNDVLERAYQQQWYHHIRNANQKVKYFVINTGVWWNPNNFRYLHNNSIIHDVNVMLDIYREYFRIDGIFLTKLHDLITNHNVTVLWRDTVPAGSCTGDLYHYHSAFSTMNLIAHESLKQIGVVIIPNIWKESLRYWNFHLEFNVEKVIDVVHYCIFHNQSVVTSWIIHTIDCMLESKFE